jgi:DNA-binding transcriptional LysR family regulator
LFERTKRRVQLTAAGHALLEIADRVLKDLEQGVNHVRLVGGAIRGTLRVGVLFQQYARQGPASSLLRQFQERHPNVRVETVEISEHPVGTLLREQTIDIAFVHAPVDDDALEVIGVALERYAAAIPSDHPLALEPELSLSALSKEVFLLPPREIVPEKHDEILGFCRRARFEPRLGDTAPGMAQMLERVARGQGVCLVPEGTSLMPAGAVLKRLSSPYAVTNLVVVQSRTRVSSTGEAFMALARGETR